MTRDDLGDRLKRGEVYASQRIPPGSYVIVRVDGRSFHRYTENYGYKRPFDDHFKDRMVSVGHALMDEFGGIYGQTHSDECSVLLADTTELFDRRQEKIVSVAAAIATSAFALAIRAGGDFPNDLDLDHPILDAPTFDARLSIWGRPEQVVDYFHWRYVDSWVNCVSSYAYWTVRNEGYSAAEAHRRTQVSHSEKHQLLHEYGINAASLPPWQKNGLALFWEMYHKTGINPITQEEHQAIRRKITAEPIRARQDQEFKEAVRERMDGAIFNSNPLVPVER